MSVRSRLTLSIMIGLAVIGLLIFFLGPVLFASIAYPLPDEFRGPIAARAQQYGLSPNTLAALTFVESGFHKTSISGGGAVGPTQFLRSTATGVANRLGVQNFSPNQLLSNVDLAEWFAAYYLSTDVKTYGSLHLALVAYNGGGGAATASARGFGFPATEAYANKIERIQKAYDVIYGQWWTTGAASQPTPASPAAPATPAPQQFNVQPNTNLSVVTSGSVLDIWQGLISNQSGGPAATPATGTTPGDVTNLWKALIPPQ